MKCDVVPSITSTTSDSLNLDGEDITHVEQNTGLNKQKHHSSQVEPNLPDIQASEVVEVGIGSYEENKLEQICYL